MPLPWISRRGEMLQSQGASTPGEAASPALCEADQDVIEAGAFGWILAWVFA